MKQTALTQLKKWIVKFEETNGTPTMCEVKAQIEMLKEIEKDIITEAYSQGRIDEETRFPYATDGEDYFKLEFTQSSE